MGDRQGNDQMKPEALSGTFRAFVTTAESEALTPAFQRFYDNKENVDPLSRFATVEGEADDTHSGNEDDDKKPSFSGRKPSKGKGLKFGLASCTKKSKSPLPEGYPRMPFQDITDVLYPDNAFYRGDEGCLTPLGTNPSTPGPNSAHVYSSKGKRKAVPMDVELVVEDVQLPAKRQQWKLASSSSRGDGKNVRSFR